MAGPQAKLLTLFPLLALVAGFLEYGPGRGPEAGSVVLTLHAVSSLLLVLAWFWIDARRRGYRASIGLAILMVGLTILALPYYLFRSRGFAGGLKALALSCLLFAGTMSAYRLGSLFA